MGNIILKVSNLSFSYDSKKIIDDVSFEIKSNTINAILCSNNSCKTTLIKLLSGVIDVKDGEITIDDLVFNKSNSRDCILKISTIIDDIDEQYLFDNVEDEIRYPLINLKYKERKIDEIVDRISNLLKINSILDNSFSNLKRFDKIKVLLAASIAHSPKLLLLDDIFRFLSSKEKIELSKILKSINEEYKTTILFTTSSLEELIDIQNIIVINDCKIIMNDSFDNIIMSDNELSKIGIEIPLMIDLSRKLQFYKLIDSIYYDPDKVVNKLWN